MAKHQYGHGTYFKMLDIARRFDMPVDVVAATILRAVLSECYDFKCEHPEDKIEIKRLPPHCKWCWTFIEILQKPKHFENVMGREETTGFLKVKPKRNKFEEELRRKLRREPVMVEEREEG